MNCVIANKSCKLESTCMDACNSALKSGAGTAIDSLENFLTGSSACTFPPALCLVFKFLNRKNSCFYNFFFWGGGGGGRGGTLGSKIVLNNTN